MDAAATGAAGRASAGVATIVETGLATAGLEATGSAEPAGAGLAANGAAGLGVETATVALANSPIYKLFPAFLAKQLIGGQSFSSIKVFGAWFSRLRATGAQRPPLAVLIERLAN